MNFENVFIRQQWKRERRFMLDWLLLALLAIVFTPWPAREAMPVVTAIFASGLGTSIGGYATRTRSWEFLMTRGFSRERFVRANFVAVLVPVAAFALLGFMADAIDLGHRIHGLFVPSAAASATSFSLFHHLAGLAIGSLVAANSTLLALRSTRPEALPGLRVASFFFCALAVGAVFVALGAVRTVVPSDFDADPNALTPSVVVSGLLIAVAGFVALHIWFARTDVKRRQIHAVESGTPESPSGGCLVLVITAIVIALLFAFWGMSPRVSPSATPTPSGATQPTAPQGK